LGENITQLKTRFPCSEHIKVGIGGNFIDKSMFEPVGLFTSDMLFLWVHRKGKVV